MTQEIVKQQSLNPQPRKVTGEVVSLTAAALDERVLTALDAASDKKALDVVVLDLREIASFTDYFVIASGANERQVQAIADEVYEKLKKTGSAKVEGYKTAEWVLLDFGDFVVHIFEQKARLFYDLERLWREAKKIEVSAGEKSDAARSLSTE